VLTDSDESVFPEVRVDMWCGEFQFSESAKKIASEQNRDFYNQIIAPTKPTETA